MLLHVCSKYFCLIFNAKQKEEGEDKKKNGKTTIHYCFKVKIYYQYAISSYINRQI